jgi:hypothetical protein
VAYTDPRARDRSAVIVLYSSRTDRKFYVRLELSPWILSLAGRVTELGRLDEALRTLDEHGEVQGGQVFDRHVVPQRRRRQELARRSYGLTEVRILDLLILSVTAAARPAVA